VSTPKSLTVGTAAALIFACAVFAEPAQVPVPTPIKADDHPSQVVPDGWEKLGDRDAAKALVDQLKDQWSLLLTHDDRSDVSRYQVHLRMSEFLSCRFIRLDAECQLVFALHEGPGQPPHPFLLENSHGGFIFTPHAEAWSCIANPNRRPLVGRALVERDDAGERKVSIGFGFLFGQKHLPENLGDPLQHDVSLDFMSFIEVMFVDSEQIELWTDPNHERSLIVALGKKSWMGVFLRPDAEAPAFPVYRFEAVNRKTGKKFAVIEVLTDPASINLDQPHGRITQDMVKAAGFNVQPLNTLNFILLFRRMLSGVQRVFGVRGYEPSEKRREVFRKLHELAKAAPAAS